MAEVQWLFMPERSLSFGWLFAINRTTVPRIYNCSELVCAVVDLDTVVYMGLINKVDMVCLSPVGYGV